jgi:hypothetical protein
MVEGAVSLVGKPLVLNKQRICRISRRVRCKISRFVACDKGRLQNITAILAVEAVSVLL